MSRRKKIKEVLGYIDTQLQVRPDAWDQNTVARPSSDGLVACFAGYSIMIHDQWTFREWEVFVPENLDWSNSHERTAHSLAVFVFKKTGRLIEDYVGTLLEVDPAQCWEIFSHNDDCWYSYKEFIGKPQGSVLTFPEYCQLVARLTGVEYIPTMQGDMS